MYIRSLSLYNFRNIENGELTFSEGLNVIHGNNGQGKTNLIEALHFLSATKSFRTSKSQEFIRWGECEASAHVKLVEKNGDIQIGCIFRKEGRELLVNNKKTSAVDFVGKLLCVTFSPADIEMIKGAPLIRRRFLDKHIVDLQPISLKYIIHYNTALKNKITLLKDRNPSTQQLDSWDRVLSDAASHIMHARSNFVKKLKTVADNFYQRYAEIDGSVDLKLKTNISLDDISPNGIFEFIRARRDEEISQRSALFGPHRDDLVISLNEKNSRLYASQGQSKSLAIALKLGVIDLLEASRAESPVILLDDVDSELDSDRLSRLYEIILADKRQVFITGTEVHKSLKTHDLPYSEFIVSTGKIEKI